MKREDVLNVDSLKEQLSEGMGTMNRTLRAVFGDADAFQVVYALDTVIERHNALKAELTTVHAQLDIVRAQLHTVTERLLRLEEHLSDEH